MDGAKYTTISCSISGVPRIMAIYIFTKKLISGFLDIRPNDIISPKGRENSRVSKKISTETTIPSLNCFNITVNSISHLFAVLHTSRIVTVKVHKFPYDFRKGPSYGPFTFLFTQANAFY